MPFKNASIQMSIRNKKFRVEYITDERLPKQIIISKKNKTETITLNDFGKYTFAFDEVEDDMNLSVINFHEWK